ALQLDPIPPAAGRLQAQVEDVQGGSGRRGAAIGVLEGDQAVAVVVGAVAPELLPPAARGTAARAGGRVNELVGADVDAVASLLGEGGVERAILHRAGDGRGVGAGGGAAGVGLRAVGGGGAWDHGARRGGRRGGDGDAGCGGGGGGRGGSGAGARGR